MIDGSVGVSSSGVGLNDILESLKLLSKIDVLVGIPEEESSREEGSSREGGEISNAYLAFIQTEGSPINKIPPRPFLKPAIDDSENQEKIEVELRKAAKFALDGNVEATNSALNRAGMQGQNVVRDWFTNPKNGWPPNSPYTILEKLRKMNSSIARAAVRHVDEGGSLSDISGLEGMTRPMIDTDQLRKAVSYVIREKE